MFCSIQLIFGLYIQLNKKLFIYKDFNLID